MYSILYRIHLQGCWGCSLWWVQISLNTHRTLPTSSHCRPSLLNQSYPRSQKLKYMSSGYFERMRSEIKRGSFMIGLSWTVFSNSLKKARVMWRNGQNIAMDSLYWLHVSRRCSDKTIFPFFAVTFCNRDVTGR